MTSVSESPSFDVWPEGVHEWFERRLRIGLSRIRDNEKNNWWLREALADREIVEWVVRWYCGYMDDYIKPADPDEVWVSEVDGHDRRIHYDLDAVANRIHSVVRQAQMEAGKDEEARKYTDLDSWLEALHTGQLEWDGPSEREGCELVADIHKFCYGRNQRRRTWPRLCRGCSTEFRPDRANARNCPDCRAKRRAKPRAKQQAKNKTGLRLI